MPSLAIRSIFIATLAASSLIGCSERTPEEHIQLAKEHLAKQQTHAAIIELKNVVAKQPQNTEARLLLGQAHLENGASAFAIKEFTKAQKNGLTHAKVARFMTEALFQSQDYQSTIDYLEELPDKIKRSTPLFTFYEAWSYYHLNDREHTKALLVTHTPDHVSPYAHAGILLRTAVSDDTEAYDQAKKQLLSNPSLFADAHLLIGQLSYVKADYDSAIEHLKLYEAKRPQHLSTHFALAKTLMNANETEQAEVYINKLIANVPESPQANELAAGIEFEKENYEKASQFIEKAIQNGADTPQNHLLAGLSAYKNKNFEKAYYHLEPLSNMLKPNHVAKRVLLATQVILNKHDEAFDNLVNLEEMSEEDISLINATSYALINSGENEKAAQLLDHTQGQQLDTQQLHQQGILKLSIDDESGIELLKQALKKDPNHAPSKLTYAAALYRANNIKEAKVFTEELIEAEQLLEQSRNLHAAILLKENNIDKAESNLKQVLAINKSNATANLYFAKQALKRKQANEALPYLTNLLNEQPDHFTALLYYREAQQQLGQPELALDKVREGFSFDDNQRKANSKKQNPLIQDRVSLRLALFNAELELNNNEAEKALTILNKVDKQDSTLPPQYWQLLIRALAVTKETDKFENALMMWERHTSVAEPYTRLANLYEKQNNLAKAYQTVQDGLARFPEDSALRLMNAHILIEQKSYSKAQQALDKLKNQDIDQVIVEGLEGRLLAFKGDHVLALPKVEAHYNKIPSARTAGLLYTLYQKQEKPEKAKAFIEQHLEQFPQDNPLRLILANQYLHENKEQAHKLYLASLAYSPNNLIALNNTAWLYYEKGELDQAEKYASKALDVAPENSAVLDTNGLILLRKEEFRRARKLLAKAYKLSPKNHDIAVHYAEALIENNDIYQAERVLEKIKQPNDETKKEINRVKEKIKK
ncbi:XrtA/PEP-CTERM system TPR-repeat protein PrsT [Flocculibacter collagenilyticus]|uniref:XrtA/PEP-CTERM system TPR-repeat protein PrsT n=1 Tax=Flocculibacter collagenilyticus TaxID=2744479 RepID=UPI0018F31517|nr:XrtA/PEP-CTERM system TPR-repeat protein PrsT [Flocculibacter collagenilyticus]